MLLSLYIVSLCLPCQMRYFFTIPNLFYDVKILVPFPFLSPFTLLQSKKRNTCLIKLLFLLNLDLCQSDDPSQREGSISIEFNLPVSGQRSVHYYSCPYYCTFLRVSNVVIILLLPPQCYERDFFSGFAWRGNTHNANIIEPQKKAKVIISDMHAQLGSSYDQRAVIIKLFSVKPSGFSLSH